MSRYKPELIISTDIGTDFDDAAALRIAMSSAIFSLIGVYTTNGPAALRAKIANTMRLLENHETLIAVGESAALGTSLPVYTTGLEEALVCSESADVSLESLGIKTDWIGAIASQLSEAKKAVVASLAPLTNIAVLLDKRPEIAKKIHTLYVMGGREGELEHNLSHDSVAARMVFESGLDIVIIPAETCALYQADLSFLTSLHGSPANEYLSRMARLWKLSHDAGLYRDSALIREIHRTKAAGFFDGDDLFYSFLELMPNTRAIFRNPFEFLEALDSWTSLASGLDSEAAVELLEYLRDNEKKTIKVSDAIVMFAIEHPDKIKTERARVSCDSSGKPIIGRGKECTLVRDFDANHFDGYFRARMSGLQKPKIIGRMENKKMKVA